jgi:molecular chaperone DnaK (HSP70)
MRFGVDFGTTRMIVAAVDRGNYPLVSFEVTGDTQDQDGGTYDWFPSLIAVHRETAEACFGWDAWHKQSDSAWTVLRSVKRFLEEAGPHTRISLHDREYPAFELLTGLTGALLRELRRQFGADQKFEVMLGVPANANSNQRFLTVDAFRRAGFEVLGLLNEPSAAAIEFGHRQKAKGRILVYDLGGGTFDVSLVEMETDQHTVLKSHGISNLGGDDFDMILAEMAAGKDLLHSLYLGELFRLEEECRRQKEALHPNSRRIVVDLDAVREGLGQVTIAVADYYERCRSLVDETVAMTAKLAEGEEIDALYVTGGGSELPLVARVLREEFGRKVKRSEYTRSATAIGLAIQADAAAGYKLREVFNRNFGVWRETDSGNKIIFDPIFPRGTRLPAAGEAPISVRRSYSPVHNVGFFRYLEAREVSPDGQPLGDITVWDEIRFPFDPELAGTDLEQVGVDHSGRAAQQTIEEEYSCDATGVVTVAIRNLTAGYGREYQLGRWSGKPDVLKPSARKRARKAAS